MEIKHRDKHDEPEGLVVSKSFERSLLDNVNYFFEAKIGFNKFDLFRLKGLYRYHFIESLILAQDERWRRA